MKFNLQINNLAPSQDQVEIVERKGLGHPDTICDLLVDYLSNRLSQIYKREFGQIPHFNIDKAMLAAGTCKNHFGGGKMIEPMLFVIGDRATSQVGKKKINLNKIIKKEIYSFLKANYRFINEKNFIIQNEIKPGSSSLQDIFSRRAKFLPANDTSALVGFAPWSALEMVVFQIEQLLNGADFKKEHPETGEDIKIMGERVDHSIKITAAVAFVDRYLKNEKDYFTKKKEIKKTIEKFVRDAFPFKFEIIVNTLDQEGRGVSGCYLTVLGTSADSGDSGEVGRGNRANGLISLNRPAGSEAAAGKNSVSHVGKIYNLLTYKIADEIYRETKKRNYIWLVSRLGQPIDQPQLVSVQAQNLRPKEKDKIRRIVKNNFDNLHQFIDDLIIGKYRSR